MLKKVLYILASITLGFLLITYAIYYDFYAVFKTFTSQAVASQKFIEAEKYYSNVFDKNYFYDNTFDLEDGKKTTVHIYSSVNDSMRYVKDEDGKQTSKYYYTLESSIQFSFFNLESFTETSKTDANGVILAQAGVELTYDLGTIFFPFITEEINFFNYVEYYSFLPLNIFYDDLCHTLGVEDATNVKFTSGRLVDGNGDTKLVFNFSNPISFDTELHNAYYPKLKDYNLYQADLDNKIENKTELLTKLTEEIKALNSDGKYEKQHSVDIIYKSAKFITTMVLVVVVYLAIVAAIGYLLFRKRNKPAKFVPKNAGSIHTTITPQQFSRDDIFGEEGKFNEKTDVVDTDASVNENEEEK